ncbi:MAG: helix-turn-helix domain-containing protein [Rubinisphaera brasiliensis]|uniref:helix-turn-helix domain-containing protein n=1 Tax=Rubinisphaera brasiliensis TaxID=119 RepID=UPI00391AED56|nr:helix-turn-helix domain-containing protein [bacterium]
MKYRTALKLTRDEVQSCFPEGVSAEFPAILSVDQAARLLQVSKSTVYQWHSQNRLTGCAQRVGKHLRFFRDRLVMHVMNKGV